MLFMKAFTQPARYDSRFALQVKIEKQETSKMLNIKICLCIASVIACIFSAKSFYRASHKWLFDRRRL